MECLVCFIETHKNVNFTGNGVFLRAYSSILASTMILGAKNIKKWHRAKGIQFDMRVST